MCRVMSSIRCSSLTMGRKIVAGVRVRWVQKCSSWVARLRGFRSSYRSNGTGAQDFDVIIVCAGKTRSAEEFAALDPIVEGAASSRDRGTWLAAERDHSAVSAPHTAASSVVFSSGSKAGFESTTGSARSSRPFWLT